MNIKRNAFAVWIIDFVRGLWEWLESYEYFLIVGAKISLKWREKIKIYFRIKFIFSFCYEIHMLVASRNKIRK